MDLVLWIRAHSVAAMVVMFCAIALTTYWPGRKKSVERNGSIPLRDDM
jgi:cbb3-type cytochrome oxidase subunit 3